jgi:hypothetical protein
MTRTITVHRQPRRIYSLRAVALAAMLALFGCFQSTRHVSYPDGTVTVEKGTCGELVNAEPNVTGLAIH